jgi:hypothetical protein
MDVDSIPRFVNCSSSYLEDEKEVQSPDKALEVFTRGNRKIASYSAFHEETFKTRGLTILRTIQFNKHLEGEAAARWRSYEAKSSWIGMHIRGTDHKNCLSASPVSLFKEYIESHSTSTFFLFTDEMEVKKDIVLEFINARSCLVVLGRLTPTQQRMGVVEWLMLQKFSKIVASKGSSFSEMAAARSGAELITLTKFS